MSHDATHPDLLFVTIAAIVYRTQLVILYNDLESAAISPIDAHRRCILFYNMDTSHFNWGHPFDFACPLADDCDNSQPGTFVFKAPNIRGNEPIRAMAYSSLSSSVQISESHASLLHKAHCGFTGHPGVRATYKLLLEQGHQWKGMTAQITQFVKRCPTCCSSRLALHCVPVSASTLRLQSRPLCRWHIDQTGNIGECAFTGFKKIIAFVCETTGFA